MSKRVLHNHPYLAIEGCIGAGKTTLANRIASDFQRKLILEQFTDNPFLPFFYENQERYAFPVELFFMTERHKQLQEELSQTNLFQEGAVADYFFIKTLLFARNNLSEEEYRLFQRLFNVLNATFPNPDLLIYLYRPIDELLANINKRGRSFERDIKADYLKSIQDRYLEYLKTVTEFPALILNVTNLDFSENNEDYHHILNLIDQPYPNGLTRINF